MKRAWIGCLVSCAEPMPCFSVTQQIEGKGKRLSGSQKDLWSFCHLIFLQSLALTGTVQSVILLSHLDHIVHSTFIWKVSNQLELFTKKKKKKKKFLKCYFFVVLFLISWLKYCTIKNIWLRCTNETTLMRPDAYLPKAGENRNVCTVIINILV